MRAADRQVQKALRIEDRLWHFLERLSDRLARDLRGLRPVSVAAHAVDHHQQHRLGPVDDQHAILIFLAAANEAQFCAFKLQIESSEYRT